MLDFVAFTLSKAVLPKIVPFPQNYPPHIHGRSSCYSLLLCAIAWGWSNLVCAALRWNF